MSIQQFSKSSTATFLTGRKIPLIGYGTYKLQGNDCILGTKLALNYGYTHIDTASLYAN
jgi:diketogulonate reductase-like aldo/keto reductase